ncbi:hypothetical protein CC99x_010465 [Candidatus Berkiella cookevillensis]|uniref:Uncharacterized protein n=1 Tax=Candidatus Berkiella cookevillensis TaxID=437022 RepID=A0A0Q9YRD2_9GAMM|nr:hypothetical protein [Candidatus Berkiella cookevillensis]MCS5709328.1 hypothetical protein [Candidatus Berkiella cookevillensis]
MKEKLLKHLGQLLAERSVVVTVNPMAGLQSCVEIVVDECVDKGKTALWFSLVGALGANCINLLMNRIRARTNQTHDISQEDTLQRMQSRLVFAQQALNRSVVGSSTGFLARVSINMLTSGSDLTINVSSRVIADSSAKIATHYMPEYTGTNDESWAFTIGKATTSAVVGTMTYYFSSLYTTPTVSRFMSASASALSEQTMDYIYRRRF